MGDKMIIKVEHLTKRFGTTVVLDDVSVNFKEGRIHGIIGRNGSGKTMLMKCICGFSCASKGAVTVAKKIVGKDVEIPDDIGVIIETPGFVTNYSGYKNLKLLASVRNKISDEDIVDVMKRVGLDPKSKKHVGKYSLGMRQRLGIAQAIMENPKILVLDEPMNGLDNDGVQDMRKLFLSLKGQGKTILIASHNREDIDMLCDCVYEMDKGRLICKNY
ncbi:MAG: ATP-binding cassette domain-containing protein [Lachnospiraceae bacterium]|nr:ATP-binding cassette domain-containing protein [Lachnospiraceae bacterium]